MDKEVLESRLRERCEQTIKLAIKAVEETREGQWIAGSEWQVREAFQKLGTDCYREILQQRIDASSAGQTAFSPSGKAGGEAARQGDSQGPRTHRQRRG